jgi:hypothetical protein
VGVGPAGYAVEWSDGSGSTLGGIPGYLEQGSEAFGINESGQVVGYVQTGFPIPEPSTWAMTLLGFAGLSLAGYHRAKADHTILAG